MAPLLPLLTLWLRLILLSALLISLFYLCLCCGLLMAWSSSASNFSLSLLRSCFGDTCFSKASPECPALPRAQWEGAGTVLASEPCSAQSFSGAAQSKEFFGVELVLKGKTQHAVENSYSSFQLRFYSAQHWAWSRSLCVLVLSNLLNRKLKKPLFLISILFQICSPAHPLGKQQLQCIILNRTSPAQHHH